MSASLPEPRPGRFRPLRIGIVELYLYEAQEFPFRDGRLLLRGDNGSGKSKVLALSLPLLLDANLRPERVEPDADPGKKIAWNLLMGDEHDERTGYSWIEFGRIDDDGSARFVTLGIGLKAVQHGPMKHWWFITGQRMGEELHLVDRSRVVRTKERLIEALGPRGTVFDTADRYRRAVDEALFGLGEERYAALVELLLQLRQPQLSKRPNEAQLDRALSRALAPMPDELVQQVAQSYQALDDETRSVEGLRRSAVAVREFTGEYRRYAAVSTLRATGGIRRAQYRYEDRNGRLREAEERLGEAAAALERARADARAAAEETARTRAELDALRERSRSDEFDELENARREADHARSAAGALGAALAEAERVLQTLRSAASRARERRDDALDQSEGRRTGLAESLRAAGIPVPDDEDAPGRVERELDRRRAQAERIRELLRVAGEDESAAADAIRRAEASDARAVEECERLDAAQTDLATAAASWLETVRERLDRAVELRGEDLDPVLERAADWVGDPEDDSPVAAWADATRARVGASLERMRAALHRDGDDVRAAIGALDEELVALEAGTVRRPPPPHTRGATRTGRPGAAFWECIELAPGVAAADAAGIEAALEASGLLDAWVLPDGVALLPDDDTVLRPVPCDGASLADVLLPDSASGVDARAIAALLGSIALSDAPEPGSASVGRSGAFALGPLVGSWRKDAPEYLGTAARDRARVDRVRLAREERDALAAEERRIDESARETERRAGALAAERAALPSERPLREAAVRVRERAQRTDETAADARAARTAASTADERRTASGAALDDAAAELGLPPATLPAVTAALATAPERLRELRRAIEGSTRAEDDLRRAEEDVAAARSAADESRSRSGEADARRASAEERHRVLESTVGVEARELATRIAAAETAERAAAAAESEAVEAREAAVATEAAAAAKREASQVEAAAAAGVRREETDAFRAFAASGLPALAAPHIEVLDPGTEWAPDPAVRLARRLLDALGGAEPTDEQSERSLTRMHNAFDRLQSELSAQGWHAAREAHGDAWIVDVQRGSERVAPAALSDDLDQELVEREELLTAREREILENHLVDEVGAELQGRVRRAMQQVQTMNAELQRRPTRAGFRLRIRWESRDEGVDTASRRLFERHSSVWSTEDRDAVGDFLRDRIHAARLSDPDSSWYERLSTAFDYRSWNRFAVQLSQDGARWRSASGPASGGERVLASTVPLFAAASSHYESAGYDYAPRLILLDEAFAGVDDHGRADYLGLLARYDLDVVMTSEREWATYPEVPGIAIAQLFRLPGTKAVHVEHWHWDGRARTRAADPGSTAVETPLPPARTGDVLALELGDG